MGTGHMSALKAPSGIRKMYQIYPQCGAGSQALLLLLTSLLLIGMAVQYR